MANKKGSHQLTRTDRIKLEALLKEGISKSKIAEHLGVHRSTIYNELKRGQYERRNSDWTTEMRYSPDIAQERAEENLKARGTQLKIGNDIAYANYIEDKIVNEDYSPAAVLGELKAKGKEGEFKTTVCVTTLYSYIDKGIFLKLTNKDLSVKRNKKRKYKKVRRKQARASAGDSIEKRPEEINERKEFGHWEMDSVIGKRGKSKNTLLVLTERTTRNEVIFKLPDHTDESVVAAMDRLEKRTHIYYCHPFSIWERGTNVVTNNMVRRKVPKGTNFDDKTDEEVQEIEDWINKYPRKIHGYRSSGELFEEEIEKLA